MQQDRGGPLMQELRLQDKYTGRAQTFTTRDIQEPQKVLMQVSLPRSQL